MKVDNSSRNTAMICGTIIFVATLAGVLGILHYTHDPNTSIPLVTIMVGLLAPTLGVIATLLGLNSVKQNAQQAMDTADSVKRDTAALRNGEMEAKIRRVVAQCLIEHSIDNHPDKPPKVTKR